MSYIIKNQDISQSTPKSLIGGKAYNLSTLDPDLSPAWCVLTTETFELFLKYNNIKENLGELLSTINENNVDQVHPSILKLFTDAKVPLEILSQLKELLNFTNQFAVRSSAIDEDGEKNSFAGIMESFLFQSSIETVSQSIIDCYISCFSPRAIRYRLQKSINLRSISCAVIVQEMINSEKSGVLFTANPSNGLRNEFLISSNYGLGEGVVSGECVTDEYTYDINSGEITSNISNKDFFFTPKEDKRGIEKKEINRELVDKSSLNDSELKEISKVGLSIQKKQLFPQDIEWAIANGNIYILQTRNITALPTPKENQYQNLVFDNSNIQESFCGITTPLTFSYANEAYYRVYHQMLTIVGLKEKELKKHHKRHWNMISLIQGRVYYNINSWYEGLKLFPSFKSNKQSMEKMMGLEHPVEFIKDKNLSAKERILSLPTMIRCYYNLIKNFIKIDSVVKNFEYVFEKEYSKFDRNNFTFSSLDHLLHLNDEIVNKITSQWQAPIINDFYVMTYHGKALSLLEKYNIKNPTITLSNLLSGEEGIQSTEPTKYLLRITDEIKKDKNLLQKVIESPVQDLERLIRVANSSIQNMIDEYIELYGDRVMGELKLESLSLREDSSFLYQCIQNYSKQGVSLEKYLLNEKSLRIKTEEFVFKDLKSKAGALRLSQFKGILKKTRKSVKYRENMRLLRTRIFGLSRSIYLEIGRQMQTYNILEDSRDIFYLTLDEVERYRMGRSVQTNWKSIVNARKIEFKEYEQYSPANHFYTYGPVNLETNFSSPFKENTSSDLSGIGCYPGEVIAKVCKAFGPDEVQDIEGKILCTMRTDPGWAPIFPMIKGLIVERGSILSHSAVIARELGIPTIVNIPNITKILNNGDTIKMDGEIGNIQIITS